MEPRWSRDGAEMEPRDALIVQNKDEVNLSSCNLGAISVESGQVSIPLELEQLPTPKAFRDAIASLKGFKGLCDLLRGARVSVVTGRGGAGGQWWAAARRPSAATAATALRRAGRLRTGPRRRWSGGGASGRGRGTRSPGGGRSRRRRRCPAPPPRRPPTQRRHTGRRRQLEEEAPRRRRVLDDDSEPEYQKLKRDDITCLVAV